MTRLPVPPKGAGRPRRGHRPTGPKARGSVTPELLSFQRPARRRRDLQDYQPDARRATPESHKKPPELSRRPTKEYARIGASTQMGTGAAAIPSGSLNPGESPADPQLGTRQPLTADVQLVRCKGGSVQPHAPLGDQPARLAPRRRQPVVRQQRGYVHR